MPELLLRTKLFVPPLRPGLVPRPHLINQLNAGLQRRLTVISAPAGFGKTTLASAWAQGIERKLAWVSLDEGDSDPYRFLAYFIAALQTISAQAGKGLPELLLSTQPPPVEALLTPLLNDIANIKEAFTLVLDDYQMIESPQVDEALSFLLSHAPPCMHLVIATRADPHLPLARLRARGQLNELRAADLRFTAAETAEFLNRAAGIDLSGEEIAALEARTEGWAAGLQLAAISMQSSRDTGAFIRSFSGSHQFVLDYLVEEVLQGQPEAMQAFLLRTAMLDRFCGPLCDAVLGAPPGTGQATLEALERANLFIVPLDEERRWFRYHHLFADLLRLRLGQQPASDAAKPDTAACHRRASQWYEENGLAFEAFQHAVAAKDIDRAARLMESTSLPTHYHHVVSAILNWLAALPKSVKDAKPLLWIRQATFALTTVQTAGIEERLLAAENALNAALQGAEADAKTRDLFGQIAAARATLALFQYRADDILAQAQRANRLLLPENLNYRFTATWTLGAAWFFKGDRAATGRAYGEALSICQQSGRPFHISLAHNSLGQLQQLQNQLCEAHESYLHALQVFGDYPLPSASEAYSGLAQIEYEWNDLASAREHAEQSLRLARLYDQALDRYIRVEVFIAQLEMAHGRTAAAAGMLSETMQTVIRRGFTQRAPEVAEALVVALLRLGNLAAAEQTAQQFPHPVSRARVLMAQGQPAEALGVLEEHGLQMEARGWVDEQLRCRILQALALHALGETEKAATLLASVLQQTQPGNFMRSFVDEGKAMAHLLARVYERGTLADYAGRLLAAFAAEKSRVEGESPQPQAGGMAEPLSRREAEVLGLLALGLSNHEIGARLYLALDTVKGHNRRIFEKLRAQNRTQAVARARELGLL